MCRRVVRAEALIALVGLAGIAGSPGRALDAPEEVPSSVASSVEDFSWLLEPIRKEFDLPALESWQAALPRTFDPREGERFADYMAHCGVAH